MKFDLCRSVPTKFTQPGSLFWNGQFQCYTLEFGSIFTPGMYELRIIHSGLLNQSLPGIFALPKGTELGELLGFIHPGTPTHMAAKHIMLGNERRLDMVIDSRKAYKAIFDLIDDARVNFDEKVILEIRA